jgi:hypothetical protein
MKKFQIASLALAWNLLKRPKILPITQAKQIVQIVNRQKRTISKLGISCTANPQALKKWRLNFGGVTCVL